MAIDDSWASMNPGKLPRHIAIIMDGNGRWAEARSRPRVWGHRRGADSVRAVVETAAKNGVEYLTLYAFSDENWARPSGEVKAIMALLDRYLLKEVKNLDKNNIRIVGVGDRSKLSVETRKRLSDAEKALADNTGLTLNLAISYGARNEIVDVCRRVAEQAASGKINFDQLDESYFNEQLWTFPCPPVDLLIRTGGEKRISNFLLWQIAYAELYFTPVMWPDFREADLNKAIVEYGTRTRRFGRVLTADEEQPPVKTGMSIGDDRQVSLC